MNIPPWLLRMYAARGAAHTLLPAAGRAGGVPAGAALRPVAGLASGVTGAPVQQQDFRSAPSPQPQSPLMAASAPPRGAAMPFSVPPPSAEAPPDVRALDTTGQYARGFTGTPLEGPAPTPPDEGALGVGPAEAQWTDPAGHPQSTGPVEPGSGDYEEWLAREEREQEMRRRSAALHDMIMDQIEREQQVRFRR